MAHEEKTPPPSAQERGHEYVEANVKGILVFTGALLAALLLVFAAVAGLTYLLVLQEQSRTPPPSPFAELRQPPPPPRLQVVTRLELWEQQAHDQQILQNYGWVDRQNGVVRVPIDRAMDLLLHQRSDVPASQRQDEQDEQTTAPATGPDRARAAPPAERTPVGPGQEELAP